MALQGELKGLDGTVCEGCRAQLVLDVQRSAAGWYLGYFCGRCGPYSRETGYFDSCEKADAALDAWLYEGKIPDNVRDTDFHR